MTHSKLMTTVAAIALTAGTAFAGSSEVKESEMELKPETELEQAAENTGQAIEETAADAAAATEEAVEQTAAAAGELAEDAEQTAEAAIEETGEAMNAAGEEIESAAAEAGAELEQAAEATEQAASEAVESTEEAVETAEMEASEELATQDLIASDFDGMTVGEIVGMNVYSTNNEDVGEIDYIVRDGDAYAAVIGIGGFLGLGEYTVAIPLEQFSLVDGEVEGLKLSNWTEEELEAQPEFDESGDVGLDDDYRIEMTS
jgi:hypothetical protein